MSSQWWPAKESWWSHRTASRRGADCRTAKLGLKLGSSHRMAIYSQILWRTIGFGGIYLFSDNHVGSMAETCWNMLKPHGLLGCNTCKHGLPEIALKNHAVGLSENGTPNLSKNQGKWGDQSRAAPVNPPFLQGFIHPSGTKTNIEPP